MHDISRDSINEYVGRAIRNLRINRNITLNELAEQLDLSYQQVQKYETGMNRVGADMLYEIANALNTEVSMFFPTAQLTQSDINPGQLKLLREYEAITDQKLRDILSGLIHRLASVEIHN